MQYNWKNRNSYYDYKLPQITSIIKGISGFLSWVLIEKRLQNTVWSNRIVISVATCAVIKRCGGVRAEGGGLSPREQAMSHSVSVYAVMNMHINVWRFQQTINKDTCPHHPLSACRPSCQLCSARDLGNSSTSCTYACNWLNTSLCHTFEALSSISPRWSLRN